MSFLSELENPSGDKPKEDRRENPRTRIVYKETPISKHIWDTMDYSVTQMLKAYKSKPEDGLLKRKFRELREWLDDHNPKKEVK